MADKYIEMELKKIREKVNDPEIGKDIDDLLDYCGASQGAHKALEDRTDIKVKNIHGVAVVSRKYT